MQTRISFVFINGINAVGKDTLANRIYKTALNPKVISTGDMYRNALNNEGEYAYLAPTFKPYFKMVAEGKLLPPNVITDAVKEAVYRNIEREGVRTFIFTGFPRNLTQLELVDDLLEEIGESKILISSFHIGIEASEETATNRSTIRMIKDFIERGKVFRKEDIPGVFEERLKTFFEETFPMLERLENEGRLIKVNGELKPDEVWREVLDFKKIPSFKERS